MAMLRHRAAAKSKTPALLLYSSRTFEDIPRPCRSNDRHGPNQHEGAQCFSMGDLEPSQSKPREQQGTGK
jgi:hypothetical protein